MVIKSNSHIIYYYQEYMNGTSNQGTVRSNF